MHRTAGPNIRLLILSVGLALAVALPAMAGYAENHTFASDELTVRNLIGEIQVAGHGGSAFEVEVTVRGKDASDGIVRVRAEEGSHATLDVVFPSEGRFVYPNLGRGSRTTIRIGDHEDNGWLSNLLGHMFDKNRIEVRSSGTGLEVWADVTIRVPNGATLIVKHGVGQVKAQNVDGDITLATRSGSVDAERIDGRLLVDTGSGHVEIADVNGNLLVDTGSGHVNARNIQADEINIATGSGHVELDHAEGSSLRIDTGSGHVKATAIGTDSADIDTGSGSVTLELDRMGTGNFRIDTGSGRIRLRIPEGVSADVHAETGSGGINIDLEEGVQMRRMARDEASFSIGGGGGARITLDTGSGGITISR